MRCTNPIAIALLASCIVFSAQAADLTNNPCSLLDWKDLQSIGAVKETQFSDGGWRQEQTPKEIPGSNLYTNMCSLTIISMVGRSSVTLSLDSFTGKATEQQVSEWLKLVAHPIPDKPDPVVIVSLGNTTCEYGQYDLPTRLSDDSISDVVEYYVACDQQVGTQHISLNVHVPEGKKSVLPNPEQTKELLDKSIVRMKQQAFAPPDSLSI